MKEDREQQGKKETNSMSTYYVSDTSLGFNVICPISVSHQSKEVGVVTPISQMRSLRLVSY